MKTLKIAAVVVAAGKGVRFGRPKAFAPLAGKTLLAWTLEALAASRGVKRVVAVVAPGKESRARKALRAAGIKKSRGLAAAGGKSRHESVRLGVEALGKDWEGVVVVHDAARPFLRKEHVEAVARAARRFGAAALARRAVDTCAVSLGGKTIEGYAAREKLYPVETPQAFRAAWWRRASRKLRRAKGFTDETSFLRAAGFPVRLVLHEGFNIKITTPADLALAEAWADAGRAASRQPSAASGKKSADG